jgi:hypothetical protein
MALPRTRASFQADAGPRPIRSAAIRPGPPTPHEDGLRPTAHLLAARPVATDGQLRELVAARIEYRHHAARA